VDWEASIRAMIASLDQRLPHVVTQDPTLVEDTTAYVLQGGDPGVLQRLEKPGGGMLGLHGAFPDGQYPARGLYDSFTAVPHEVLIRWGLAIQAASGRWLHGLEVDKVYWPGTMLAQVGMAYPRGDLPFDFFDFAALLASADVHSGRLVVHAWAAGKEKYWRQSRPELTLTRLRHYEAAVEQLHQWLAPLLVDGDVDHRVHALGLPDRDDTEDVARPPLPPLVELRGWLEERAERGTSGADPRATAAELARHHRALRAVGLHCFPDLDPDAEVDPAELLLRSHYLLQQVEPALV
jgi:hypothetical protein